MTNHKKSQAKKIKDLFDNKSGLTCDHCERQYDDDMCDKCFSKKLYKEVLDALTLAESRGYNRGIEDAGKVAELHYATIDNNKTIHKDPYAEEIAKAIRRLHKPDLTEQVEKEK